MISRLMFDTLSALTLAVTALLGAYMPAYLAARDRRAGGTGRSMAYVLGNMLSAGVMVSAGFCHLLGEALRAMPRIRFPLAPFLCGAGYMLTLVADKVVSSATGHSHAGCGGGGGGGGAAGLPRAGPAADSCCAVEVLAGVDIAERGGLAGAKDSNAAEEARGLLERTPSPGLARSQQQQQQQQQQQLLGRAHANGLAGGGADALGRAASGASGASGSDYSLAAEQQAHISADGIHVRVHGANGGANGGLKEGGPGAGAGAAAAGDWGLLRRGPAHRDSSDSLSFEVGAPQGSPPGGPLLADGARGGKGGGGGSGGGLRSVTFLTAMLMGVALCFHSLLEGAAMGAQVTISNSLHIFIAIVSHKGLAAYALGSSIVDSEASMQRFWSVVLPFTFASPVGIFLGYVISDVARGTGAACISALASGTFLYVAFQEVIPRELRDPARMPSKLAALLTGYGLMSLLAVWA